MRKAWLAVAVLVAGVTAQSALFGAGEAPLFPPVANRSMQWPGLRVYSTTNEVTALAVDSRYVWVGSTGGLAVVDKATGARHTMTSADGLPGNHVTSILRTGNEAWVTTKRGLIHWRIGARTAPQRWDGMFNTDRGMIDTGPVLSDGRTVFVGEDSYWAAVSGAMVLSGGRWRDLLSSDDKEKTPSALLRLLAVTKTDCWLAIRAEDEGVTVGRHHLATDEWRTYGKADGLPQAVPIAAAPTEAGLWVVTKAADLAFFDGGSWTKHQPEILRGRTATSLAAHGASVWVGTKEGVVRGGGRPLDWAAVPGSPRDVTAVIADGDDLWCGTAHDGLWHRRAAGEWRHFEEASGPLGNDARAIAFSGGRVFLGGQSGISVLDLATGSWRSWTAAQGLLAGTIRDLVIDGKVLWYVTMQDPGPGEMPRYTLAAVDLDRGRPTGVQVSDVHAISLAKPGLLVAARNTEWGLYDIERNEWHAIGPGNYAMGPGGPVMLTWPAVASLPCIWFGADAPRGYYSGAALLEWSTGTGKFRRLADIRMGLGVSSITRDGNTLWATSFGGEPSLIRVSLSTGKATPVSRIGADWITCSAWIKPYLWLGTGTYEGQQYGLVRYHPATRHSVALATESGLPAMDITALAVQGTDLWVLTPAGVAVLPEER